MFPDVYSYDEDDMVLDSKLPEHLSHFGIDMMTMEKVSFDLLSALCCVTLSSQTSSLLELMLRCLISRSGGKTVFALDYFVLIISADSNISWSSAVALQSQADFL